MGSRQRAFLWNREKNYALTKEKLRYLQGIVELPKRNFNNYCEQLQYKNANIAVSETVNQRWARTFFCKPANRISANSWAHSAIASQRISEVLMPVRKSHISKYVMINPQIANPQICKEKYVFLI